MTQETTSMNSQPQHVAESRLLMGTLVSIQVVGRTTRDALSHAIERAFVAIQYVEETCSRFNQDSALCELCRHPGEPRQVPDVLFQLLRVALEMAEITDGLFDPTLGKILESFGFNRDYLTGESVSNAPTLSEGSINVSYQDIELDEENKTVLLRKPMLLDLGAIAKGLAVDLAAKELMNFEGFAIDAGGDLYLHGVDPTGQPWMVGIQHPLKKNGILCWLQVTDAAVCTSGSYERKSPLSDEIHHLIDPKTGKSGRGLLSCTIIAPQAMMADVVSTSTFLQGASQALEFAQELELDALCITDALDMIMTKGMERYIQ